MGDDLRSWRVRLIALLAMLRWGGNAAMGELRLRGRRRLQQEGEGEEGGEEGARGIILIGNCRVPLL